ncbi:MAG: acyl-CoA synthetase FdrA [Adlercreutzia sp.]|nr:acyl-CoA synthetase FdrA [Adlercreutzia sp.]
MVSKVEVRKGLYYDSVKLMLVSKAITEVAGVEKASVVMGTDLNKENLSRQAMDSEESRKAGPSDLIISIQADSESSLEKALLAMDEQMALRSSSDDGRRYNPRSWEAALKEQPNSNVAVVSVPGAYAAEVADEALDRGLHVMLFSDNVSYEEERRLKEKALDKDLLVMGPDCGTAVINGVPLCFSNVVQRGPVGIVSASGTGSQEVMCLLDDYGVGVSQVIGTGGRDMKEQIGGITFMQALKALSSDEGTKVIVLVSKPPAPSVAQRVLEFVSHEVDKPVVVDFIGADQIEGLPPHVYQVDTLEGVARMAAALAKGDNDAQSVEDDTALPKQANIGTGSRPEGVLRAFYAGGTLAYESALLLAEKGVATRCNLLSDGQVDPLDTGHHVIVDFGDDEYTRGRAHPMIDPSLRDEAFAEALNDEKTAVVVLDMVLGYGAHEQPHKEVIARYKMANRSIPVVVHVVGTQGDPQGRAKVVRELEEAGMVVMPSNRAAIESAYALLERKEELSE